MKDGKFHKAPRMNEQRLRLTRVSVVGAISRQALTGAAGLGLALGPCRRRARSGCSSRSGRTGSTPFSFRKKAFINSIFNGVTLAGLYFLVASGFTLVFGLMRNVNLAHGSLYLLGAYIGYERRAARPASGSSASPAGFLALAVVGVLMQVFVFRRIEGDELRQTLVTHRHLDRRRRPDARDLDRQHLPDSTSRRGSTARCRLPIITAVRANGTAVMMTLSALPPVVLARGDRHRRRLLAGAQPHAHRHDDPRRRRRPGDAVGLRRQCALRVRHRVRDRRGPRRLRRRGRRHRAVDRAGEDVRYLLASLVVVIVGGMGSITGAAIGALLIGLAEQFGLVYLPTYGIVLTFVIMVAALAFRPQGIMGRRMRTRPAPIPPCDRPAPSDVVPVRVRPRPIVLAVALLLYPLVASPFFVFQIGALFADLGPARAVADAARRLWRHGQPRPDHGRRRRRLYGRDLRHQQHRTSIGFGWPWWVLVPFAMLLAGDGFGADRRDLGAHRGHLHDHDHAGDRRRVLLLRAAELRAVQRPFRLCRHSAAARLRRRLARSRCRSTISALLVAAACYAAVLYCSRSTFGLALQAIRDNGAAHARARLRRHRAQGRRLFLLPASSPGSPACCWSGSTAASRRARSTSGRRSTCWSSR